MQVRVLDLESISPKDANGSVDFFFRICVSQTHSDTQIINHILLQIHHYKYVYEQKVIIRLT